MMDTNKNTQKSVTISLYVDYDFIDRVNKARGSVSRSTWIINVVEEYLKQNGLGKSTPTSS